MLCFHQGATNWETSSKVSCSNMLIRQFGREPVGCVPPLGYDRMQQEHANVAHHAKEAGVTVRPLAV